MADPPLYSVADLSTVITLDDVFDAHEALDLREAAARKARERR